MNAATTDTLATRNPTAKYYGFWSFAMLALWVTLWAVFLPWPTDGFWILLGTYVLADVGSYIFHYYYDHYADPQRSEIAHTFQWHHIDPGGITRRPVYETLQPAALIIVPLLMLTAVLALLGILPAWLALVLSSTGLIVLFSQLLHRWSHNRENHWTVGPLQSARLIVSKEAHDRHHQPPHGSRYAIVSGWSNPALDALGMPAALDAVMARLDVPRRTGYEFGENLPQREWRA